MVMKGSFFEEPDGIWNSICVVEDREKISVIMNELRGKTGIIADGHHRTKAMSELSEEKGANELCFNNLLVYVTSIRDNATEIGPVHRIITQKVSQDCSDPAYILLPPVVSP